MANKFTKYFEKSFLKENEGVGEEMGVDDETAMLGTLDDPEATGEAINGEIDTMSVAPEQTAMILKKADKYAEEISTHILPILRKLHTEIISGMFKQVAPDIKGISNINEDLAGLAEAIRGKVRDSVIRKDAEDKKAASR